MGTTKFMTHYLSFIQNVMISFDWIKGCRGDIPLETLDFGIVAPPVGTPWYVLLTSVNIC